MGAKRRLTASSCRRNPPGERLALDASTPLSQLSRLFSTPIPCFSPSTTPLCDHAPTPLCPNSLDSFPPPSRVSLPRRHHSATTLQPHSVPSLPHDRSMPPRFSCQA